MHVSSQARRRSVSVRSAFTLLELLLVLAILVALGALVLRNVLNTQAGAEISTTKIQLKGISDAITEYKMRFSGMPESLQSLVDGPKDAAMKQRWTGPILESVPKDAWGNELEYSVNGNKYSIRSAGIDGQMNSADDIVEPEEKK
ncbi:MAG: type II secretion system protein GspG [Planctomycetota bacterium]